MFSKPQNPLKEHTNSSIKAAIYVRVSTEEQAQNGYSINAQIEKLTATCKINGWELVGKYVDDGYSAKSLDRPNIQRLIEDSKAGKFNLVLVYKLDRLSRKLKDLSNLAEHFQSLHIGIRSITEPFDTTNSTGNLLFNMLGSFAEFERELIGERTRLGLRRRLKEGKWNGRPPYGYKLTEAGTLEIHEEETRYVQEIFRLFLEHNIGVKLIGQRIKAKDKTTRKAATWCQTAVWNTLNCFTYCGYVKIGGQYEKGPHTPIISEETFKDVQRILREKARIPAERLHSPNILSGIVKCGKCGEVMTTGKGKGIHYYVCSGRSRAHNCDMEYIPARPLENAIIGEIKAIASKPKVIAQYLAKHKSKNKGALKNLSTEKQAIESKVSHLLKLKEKRVAWLLENLPEKAVAEEVSKEIQKQLNSIEELKSRSAAIAQELQVLGNTAANPDMIAGFLNSFMEMFNGLEIPQKRLLVQGLVKDIKVESKTRARAVFSLPIAPQKERPELKTPVNLLAGKGGYPLYQSWLRD